MSIQTPIKHYFKTIKTNQLKEIIKEDKLPEMPIVIVLSSDSDSNDFDNMSLVERCKNQKKTKSKLSLKRNSSENESHTPSKKVVLEEIKVDINSSISNIKKNDLEAVENFNATIMKINKPQVSTVSSSSDTDSIDLSIFKSFKNAQNINFNEKNDSEINPILFVVRQTTQELFNEEKNDYDNHTLHMMYVINTIITHEQYSILLTDDEIKKLNFFTELSPQEKNFCVRIFYRKYSWHRVFDFIQQIKIQYTPAETISLVEKLQTLQFIITDYTQEHPELLLNLLNLDEVKKLNDSYKLPKKNSNKKQMIENILKNVNKQPTLSFLKSSKSVIIDKIKGLLGLCAKIDENLLNLFLKVQLMFSLTNPALELPADLHHLLLDLAAERVIFPDYITDSPKIFADTEDFMRFEAVYKLRRDFDNYVTQKMFSEATIIVLKAYVSFCEVMNNEIYQLEAEKLPSFLRGFTVGANLVRLLTKGIDVLKKEVSEKYTFSTNIQSNKNLKEKLIMFCFNTDKLKCEHICEIIHKLLKQTTYLQGKKGIWYEQLSLIYHQHLKNLEKAIELLNVALSSSDLSEIARLKLSQRVKMILKSKNKIPEVIQAEVKTKLVKIHSHKKITISCTAMFDTLPGRKRVYINKEEGLQEFMGVEQVAISHYKNKEGFERGIHCEGMAVVSLFGLLFWDVIYEHHVPNTFISNIQEAPLDMYSNEFYENRKAVIDNKLEKMENSNIEDICNILLKRAQQYGEIRSIISQKITSDVLDLIEIAKCMGVKILSKICERLAKMFIISRSGFPDLLLWSPRNYKCKFVEVKGQNDKLSEKQILWLKYLKDIGASVEVCHVHTTGSREAVRNNEDEFSE